MWLWALRGPTVGPYSGPILWGPTVGRWPPATALLWDPIVGPCCGPVGEHLGGPFLWAHTVEPYCVAVDLAERTVAPYSGPSLWALRGPTVGPLPAT